MLTLFPFQETGRDFLTMRKNAVLADDMGLGKTLMAIEALKKLDLGSGLIICPLGVRRTWVKTLRDQYPGVTVREITSPSCVPDPRAFNVVNYDIIWREHLAPLLKMSWPVLIADESHFLKSIESKRTKAVLGKNGIHNLCDRNWMMTGTPILNKPIELYPILRSLFPDRLGAFTDYYRYAFRYCAAFKDVFGFNVDGASNLTELSRILGPVMLRRMKEEVLDQLPGIIYEKIYLDPSDKLNGLVNKEQKAEVTEAGSIRQAIGLLKIKPAIVHLEDILTIKNKVVAFTWHKAVAQGLKDHFKERAVLFTGEESTDEKEKAKEEFIKTNKVEVFIGQLEAAGVGIDGLQLVCDTCVFVEMYSVPGKIKQAVDRLRRIGQERGVLAQFLIAENSVDEKIIDSLVEKSSNIKTILQEKGETQFVQCRCAICRRPKEVSELKRVDDQSICKTCEILSEVL